MVNGRKYWRTIRGWLNSDKIYKKYELMEKIGTGKFSSVYKAKSRISNNFYAIKIIEKSKLQTDEAELLKNETAIMKVLNHPFLICLHESFETLEYYYYILELVDGIDLYQYITLKGYSEECQASRILKIILESVKYIHSLGIIHRDLKPENIMLHLNDKEKYTWDSIKIIDFGFSIYYEELKNTGSLCGTLDYIAPEILKGEAYGFPADVFSIGVIFFFLIKGELPFHNDTHEILIKNIVEKELNFAGDPFFFNVSDECKDLLGKLLEKNQSKRITIEEALNHKFIQNPEMFQKFDGRNRLDSFDINRFI